MACLDDDGSDVYIKKCKRSGISVLFSIEFHNSLH